MAETSKAHNRRELAGWFDIYIKGKVIDVGVGRLDTHDGADPVTPDCIMHDKDICDATTMEAYTDNEFDCVHASHILEHLSDPVTAIRNWIRICKPNGHIVISLPHRNLYERKKTLPSKWNADHKYFYLPTECEPPHTFSLWGVLNSAFAGINCRICVFNTVDTATNADKPHEHNNGEFSIEVVIQKL